MLEKLLNSFKSHAASFLKRFGVLADKSAFLLTAPFAIALYFIDPTMLKTLLQWMLFAPVLAGVAVMVSRIVFTQIDLGDLVAEAKKGNVACGLVVAAIILFVGLLVIALAGWARA